MSERFWVIFDTSQYRDYYQDVHNVLALPRGAMMRYEYRSAHISAGALNLSATDAPRALLAYAQKDSEYTRDAANSEPVDDSARTVFIATRLATMRDISKRGTTFYYDFQLEGYPDNTQTAALAMIFGELEHAGSTPWTKWVTSSAQGGALDVLSRKEDDEAWAEIVQRLGRFPMQFADDVFFRVNGPLKERGGIIQPNLTDEREAGRIESSYRVVEHSSLRAEVISDTGSFSAPLGSAAPPHPDYDLAVASTNDKALAVVGAAAIPLRHHTTQNVAYTIAAAPVLGESFADLTLTSGKSKLGWPTGPSIALRHKIVRNQKRMTLGIVLSVLAVLAGVGAKAEALNIAPYKPWGDPALAVVAIILLALGGFALSGKWTFKAS